MEKASWFSLKDNGIEFFIYVRPNAKKTCFQDFYGEPKRLCIRVKAPPVDGKANQEIIDFLSECLKIPKKNIQIISGETSKLKNIFIFDAKDDLINLIKTII